MKFATRGAAGVCRLLDRRERFAAPIVRPYPSTAVSKLRAQLTCYDAGCGKRFSVDDVLYQCPSCGSLLETENDFSDIDAADLERCWRQRRLSRDPLDVSGVWRYREILPFVEDLGRVVTLSEGNTLLLEAPRAAEYGGLDRIQFKHQGYNPTGSFKDNGMTAGVTQAAKLGMSRVACVSTGNTSASMAAYAAAAGMQAIVFIPHGNIAYGKLAQVLEYGALTLQVEANFDQILALVRQLTEQSDIYLLNSINPFRIEGQKTIVVEMLDQRGWKVPDWIVMPGGNLGNVSALGKGLRELEQIGLIDKAPRIAVIQAEGSAPFEEMFRRGEGTLKPVENPETLATAIRIGAPVSWPKALHEVTSRQGTVEKVSEQEIADAKAVIGRCGIGCEPASAATLAGIRKLTAAGTMESDADVVAVLTGHLLKDPDFIYRYHTDQLKTPRDEAIRSTFGNKPVVMPNDAGLITDFLERNAE